MADQFDWWLDALDGKRGELTRGDPRSGYYLKFAGNKDRCVGEPVAIWRDQAGGLWCSIYKNGRGPSRPDEIDELFGWCSRYPIPYDLFESLSRGEPLPPECRPLTLKQIQANEAWTIEKAREWYEADRGKIERKAAREAEAAAKAARAEAAAIPEPEAENPRATIGGNAPPEPIALEEAMGARLDALEQAAAEWLASIGGKPRDQTEADIAANYRAKFLDIETEANGAHRAEKAPFLEGGRKVDKKWFPLSEVAEKLKKQIGNLADAWVKAENARLAEIARQERARIEREQAAAGPDASAAAVPAAPTPRASAGTVGRAVTERAAPPAWTITDLSKVAVYLAGLDGGNGDPEFRTLCQKLVNRLGRAGVKVPGVTNSTDQKAA